MTEERKLVTGGAKVPQKASSRESRLSRVSGPSKWKWFAQLSPLMVVLLAGSFWLGWYEGQNNSKCHQQAISDLTAEMMGTLGKAKQLSNESEGLTRLQAIHRILKEEIMVEGNHLLSRCRTEQQSSILAILESAKQHCYPKSEANLSEVIPQLVARSYFILDGKTKSLAEVYWGSEKSLYEVSLERTSEKGSFAGVCWEFAQPIDLSSGKILEIDLWTNSVGNYEFIFEKKLFSEGQSNVAFQVDKIRQWTKIKIALAKVEKKVLRELARFCIAISESTSGSPTSATMEIRGGIVK